MLEPTGFYPHLYSQSVCSLRLSNAPGRHVRLRQDEADRGRDSPVLTSVVDGAGCLGAALDTVAGCRLLTGNIGNDKDTGIQIS